MAPMPDIDGRVLRLLKDTYNQAKPEPEFKQRLFGMLVSDVDTYAAQPGLWQRVYQSLADRFPPRSLAGRRELAATTIALVMLVVALGTTVLALRAQLRTATPVTDVGDMRTDAKPSSEAAPTDSVPMQLDVVPTATTVRSEVPPEPEVDISATPQPVDVRLGRPTDIPPPAAHRAVPQAQATIAGPAAVATMPGSLDTPSPGATLQIAPVSTATDVPPATATPIPSTATFTPVPTDTPDQPTHTPVPPTHTPVPTHTGTATASPPPPATPTATPCTGAAIDVFAWIDSDGDGSRDRDAAGLAGVTLTLRNGDTAEVVDVQVTDAQGRYRFGHLAIGVYTLEASPPSGYRATTPQSWGFDLGCAQAEADFGYQPEE